MSSFDVQSLPPETRAWLEAKVKAGEFADVDACVRELLEEARRLEAEDEAEIREMVAEGLADIEQGNIVPGEQVFAELRRRHFERYGRPASSES